MVLQSISSNRLLTFSSRVSLPLFSSHLSKSLNAHARVTPCATKAFHVFVCDLLIMQFNEASHNIMYI